MNFTEYQKLALVTKSKETSKVDDFQHSGYGLVTEVGELVDAYKRQRFYKKPLDKVNLLEEVGDTLWYLAIGAYGHDFDLQAVEDKELGETEGLTSEFVLGKLAHHAANVYTLGMCYSTEVIFEQYATYDLAQILTYLRYLCSIEGIDYDQAKPVNIAKLEKRYPEGFSEYHALNRDLESERKVLENDNQG